jgi:hypothetical protein
VAGRRQLPRPEVEHKGQRHLIDFNRAALNAIHAKLIDWGIAPDADRVKESTEAEHEPAA